MKMAATIHQISRAAVMRRAWALARQRREETARRTFDLGARIVGARVIHTRTYPEVLAATPLDLGAAQKVAWAEARAGFCHCGNNPPHSGALVISRHGGALAPMRRLRFSRVVRLLASPVRWIDSRFIRRAA